MENTPFIPQTAIHAALDRIAAGEADCFILQPGCEPLPGHGRGVRPLLQLLENQPGALRGAVLADKIIGKAAAMVAALGGIAAVHTLTASEAALDFLAKRGIPAAARQTVHITYGLLLDQPWFRNEFFATMAEHEEDYYAALVRHLGKHVRILTAETDI